jgi:hypothetical protein
MELYSHHARINPVTLVTTMGNIQIIGVNNAKVLPTVLLILVLVSPRVQILRGNVVSKSKQAVSNAVEKIHR